MFGLVLPDRSTPVLEADSVLLRAPQVADYPEWRQVRERSYAHLKPYEPSWLPSDLSRASYLARLRTARREAARGNEFLFLLFATDNGQTALAGGLTISSIRRRVAQCANLGYWMAAEHAGRGLMTRAVGLAAEHVFGPLDLHRLNAACLPDNLASRRVLEKNGFREEGFAEGYLRIDGAWRDHVLFGLTRERHNTPRHTV